MSGKRFCLQDANGSAVIGEMTEGEGIALPKVSGVAYTGIATHIALWEHPVVIDLKGMAFAKKNPSLYYNHDPERGVGHITSLKKTKEPEPKLVLEGVLSRENEWARDIAASGKNDYPWQMSVGCSADDYRFIRKGEECEANGRVFKGPLYLIDKSTLYEVSFVDYGADKNTSAAVSAGATPTKGNMMIHDDEKQDVQNQAEEIQEQTTGQEGKDVRQEIRQAAPVTADQDENALVRRIRESAAAETRRINAINAFHQFDCPEVKAACISDGSSFETFKLRAYETRFEREGRASGVAPKVLEQAGLSAKTLECALAARCLGAAKAEKLYEKPVFESARRYRNAGLRHLFAEGLRLDGVSVDENNVQQIINAVNSRAPWIYAAAYDTTGISSILIGVAERILLDGYQSAQTNWREIVDRTSVRDYKVHERVDISGGEEFENIPRGGRAAHGTGKETVYSVRVFRYGKAIAIDDMMLKDDDIGAFAKMLADYGKGAERTINSIVWKTFLENPLTVDGKNLFSTNHKNLLTGASSALTLSGLNNAYVKFMQQKDQMGYSVAIEPSILLVPPELLSDARILVESEKLNRTTDAAGEANPYFKRFRVIAEPSLSNTDKFSGASATAWYLLADPADAAALEVPFLDGVEEPAIQQVQPDSDQFGIAYKAQISFGVAPRDFRAGVKSAGA